MSLEVVLEHGGIGVLFTYREVLEGEAAIFKTMPQARQWLQEKLLARGIDLETIAGNVNEKINLPN